MFIYYYLLLRFKVTFADNLANNLLIFQFQKVEHDEESTHFFYTYKF